MEKVSIARIALKWGLITALLIIVYTIFLYMTGFFKTPALSWGSFPLLLGGIILAIRELKASNHSFLSLGEGLSLGTLLSAIAGLGSSIFNHIYTTYIDTTIMKQMREIQQEQMELRGLSPEQIDQAMEMGAKFTTPGLIFIFGVLGTMFFGFIFSLIVSAILKNTKSEMNF